MVARAKQTKPDEGEATTGRRAAPRKAQPAAQEPVAKPVVEAAPEPAPVESNPEPTSAAVPEEKSVTPAAALMAVATSTSDEKAQKALDATQSAVGLWLHWWPEQLTDNIRTAQALAGCRSVAELVEIQRAYVGAAIERWNRFAA